MCCWHSLEQTIAFLEQRNLTEPVFKLIFGEIDSFTHDFEIRRLLYGLTTLIEESQRLPSVKWDVTFG
jgi:hypothetical protein